MEIGSCLKHADPAASGATTQHSQDITMLWQTHAVASKSSELTMGAS